MITQIAQIQRRLQISQIAEYSRTINLRNLESEYNLRHLRNHN
jgi:hypothetical protein